MAFTFSFIAVPPYVLIVAHSLGKEKNFPKLAPEEFRRLKRKSHRQLFQQVRRL